MSTPPISAETLERCVLEALREPAGRVVDVRPSPFASRVPAFEVDIDIGGLTRTLFVKCPGDEEADHPDKQDRRREPHVYEEVLSVPGLPVPRWFGWSFDPGSRRRVLVLERVRDWDLRYQDLDHWTAVAHQLGCLHGSMADRRDELSTFTFLPRFEASWHQAWVERALNALDAQSFELGRRFAPLAARANVAGFLLAAVPPTLVHNDCSAKNILVDRTVHPARCLFVDWEMCGIGAAAVDLAVFIAGMPVPIRHELLEAWASGADGSDVVPSDDERARVLAAAEFHRLCVLLWRNRVWGVERQRVHEWLDQAERLLQQVEGEAQPCGS